MCYDSGAMFDRNETYGERVLDVDGSYFKRYAIQLDVEVTSSHDRANNVWIVPTKFCSLRFINDPCQLKREKPLSSDNEGRSENGVFDEKSMVISDISRYNAVVIRCSREISPGE